MPEILTIECPFCNEKTVKVMHQLASYTTQTTKAAGKRKTIPKISLEKNRVLSENCSNCGKTRKEIEKCLKYGKPVSKEDIIKRAQESGLPLRF